MNKQPIKIIVNPTAGQGKALRTLAVAEAILKEKHVKYEVSRTSGPKHAIDLAGQAAKAGWPVVAAIGGDGTVNEVIQGLVHTDTALAIVPGGTGNDLARSLSVPLNPVESAGLLTTGQISAIDCGIETSRAFGVIASIGFPVDVIHYVNITSGLLKGPLKIFAAVWKTIQHLTTHHVTLYLDNKKREVDTVGICIMNTRFTGGGLMMAPEADPVDQVFDVVIIHDLSRLDLLKTLPKVYKGQHTHHPAVEIVRCSDVRIESSEPLPKMFDGDLVGYTPVDAKISPAALKVLVSPPLAESFSRHRDTSSKSSSLKAVGGGK